ncbi:hypothetical protein JB92DRAFT_3105958 [Gautieria morchelliformis]|nr:hypothetical protein JB92DRAFT_3105958 [Gautieria morchelliformis]
MLSTLSSFLPSALTDKLDKLADDSHGQQGLNDTPKPSEDPNKKHKKKKLSSNEAHLYRRPSAPRKVEPPAQPPAPARPRPPVARPSWHGVLVDSHLWSTLLYSDHALRRTSSTRSDSSAFYASSAGASGSVTSFASTASAASGRRMIIPLYNLSAHNVRPNTVVDAGTDARVARFHKRALEVTDLALLEPAEVWFDKDSTPGARAGVLDTPGIRRSGSRTSLAPHVPDGYRTCTPDPSQSPGSSRLSFTSDHSCTPHPVPAMPSRTPTAMTARTPTATTLPTPTPAGPKKLFGKLFRKKDTSPASAVPSISPPRATAKSSTKAPSPVLLPAVLGLSPTLSTPTQTLSPTLSPNHAPAGRCIAYVWTLTRWLKPVDDPSRGAVAGMLGKIGREAGAYGIGSSGQGGGGWDVRFEWVKGKSKGARRARSRTPNRRRSAIIEGADGDGVAGALRRDSLAIESPRPSLDVPRPAPTTPPSHHSEEDGDADGDESDAEDSETPWTCSLVMTHSACAAQSPSASAFVAQEHTRARPVSMPSPAFPFPAPAHAAAHAASTPAPATVKLKVATLAPAPHHPKVVCQLKIPFPLPDADVARGVLRRRGGGEGPDARDRMQGPGQGPGQGQGQGHGVGQGQTLEETLEDSALGLTHTVEQTLIQAPVPAQGQGQGAGTGTGPGGLTLTAEEIKDVVCSTAFWLVVREGLGGVGRKARKGDGWRIRA